MSSTKPSDGQPNVWEFWRTRTGRTGSALKACCSAPVDPGSKKVAVRVGFEPTEPAKVQRFSRPPDSTALAPHRLFQSNGFCHSEATFYENGADLARSPS